jgi:hypothetical protein
MSSSNNAVLNALVCALRVLRMDALISRMQEHRSMSLQAVIAMDGEYAENAGAIFSHLRLNF